MEEPWYITTLLCILRIPGIAFLDIWWMFHSSSSIPNSLELMDIAESGFNLMLLVLALVLLLLPIHELVSLYAHVLAIASISMSFVISTQFIEDEKRSGNIEHIGINIAKRHFYPIASYIALTNLTSWCLDNQNAVLKRIYPALYTLPVLINLCGFSLPWVIWLTRVVSGYMVLSVIVYCFSKLGKVKDYTQETYEIYQIVKEELGTINFLILCLRRMLEPSVLACYWFTQFIAQLWIDWFELVDKKFVIQDTDWLVQILVSMSEVCVSPLLLISFCIVVMISSCGTLLFIQKLLATCGNTAAAGQPFVQTGVTEGVVAFVLGLQTGLIEMEMPNKVGALSIILFVVIASLLQSCLDITQPVLLSLPATNRRLTRHIVPVLLTLILFCLPLLMVYSLLTKVSSDMWTLVIISTCLVTAVQALGSLANYILFLWDSMLLVPSPNMEDYVYYVKAGTKGVELFLAMAVVGGGFYESIVLDRDWSLLNTMVLVSHCYFNIYTRINQGWASYMARRETSERLSTLKIATEEELINHGDVCSICYQNMETPFAVITLCSHFFHKNCLKRWLVVQDNCPLCTKPIVAKENVETTNSTDNEEYASESDEEYDENSNQPDEEKNPIEIQPVIEETGLRQRAVAVENSVSPLFDGD